MLRPWPRQSTLKTEDFVNFVHQVCWNLKPLVLNDSSQCDSRFFHFQFTFVHIIDRDWDALILCEIWTEQRDWHHQGLIFTQQIPKSLLSSFSDENFNSGSRFGSFWWTTVTWNSCWISRDLQDRFTCFVNATDIPESEIEHWTMLEISLDDFNFDKSFVNNKRKAIWT